MPILAKFFMLLLGLAVFAVVGAWIMGGESTKHDEKITIDANPEDVFRYLTDGEKIKQWGNGIVSVGTFRGDDDEGRTQERIVHDKENGDVVWKDSLMRFQEGEAVSIQSRNRGLIRTYVFQIERNEIGGSNVEYRLTRSSEGVDRLLFSFQKEDSDKIMAAEMLKLKNLVESEVDPAVMPMPDVTNEYEEPVVASPVSGNNGSTSNSDLGMQSEKVKPLSESKNDEPFELSTPEPSKIPLSERKFESLFGTGRPK